VVKKIGLLTLMLFIMGSVDNIRNLPATAIFGSDLIFFLVASAIFFLIPCALLCAELAMMNPEESGVYAWTKRAFGPQMAMLSIWLQWINTMIWFPTILSFIAAVALHLIAPELAKNPYVLISIIVSVFWLLTIVNLQGVRISSRFAAICSTFGMVIPMIMIILLGLTWILRGHPLAIQISTHHLIPNFSENNSWISLTAIMTSFLGIELTAVHLKDIKQPQKTFPRAMLLATIFIVLTMLAGAFAIAIVIPANQLSLIDGVMESFSYYLNTYHLTGWVPMIGVMILIGSVGSLVNWMVSPAKGLLQAAEDGFIPHYLQRVNKAGVPQRLLIVQALIVTLVCSAFLFMPSVNASYWLLTDLSTQLYMLMYVILFFVALALGLRTLREKSLVFVPAGKVGLWLFALFGVIGSCVTLIVGFVPPKVLDLGGVLHYELIFAAGMILMILPGVLIAIYLKAKHTLLEHRHHSDSDHS
jgi:amino acid transporter